MLMDSFSLGSLGTIPDKYDVAVSTALAPSNMVVDVVAQGQTFIEFLRNQSIGRASLMVLPTDKPNKCEVTPEGFPGRSTSSSKMSPLYASFQGAGRAAD